MHDRAGKNVPCVRATYRGRFADLSQFGRGLQGARGMQVRSKYRNNLINNVISITRSLIISSYKINTASLKIHERRLITLNLRKMNLSIFTVNIVIS